MPDRRGVRQPFLVLAAGGLAFFAAVETLDWIVFGVDHTWHVALSLALSAAALVARAALLKRASPES